MADTFEKAAQSMADDEREQERRLRDRLLTGRASPAAETPKPGPLDHLPAVNQAGLDASYAETDKHLDAAEKARARIPRGEQFESAQAYADKYDIGLTTSEGTDYAGMFGGESPYAKLERLEKQGLLTISPDLRSELDRVRSLSRRGAAASQEYRTEMGAAAETSPRNPPVARPNGDGTYRDAGRVQTWPTPGSLSKPK